PPSLPADDADATAPRARLIALIAPEPAVSVPLDGPAPADQTSTTVVPLPRGDHFGVLVVVALGLLAVGLGWLLLA
ncbi:MAG: hypothetical protein KC464_35970, partial [Myxococcales bacterium]|nr:hypothetical protein [Myxococcales bacterium]